MHHVDDAETPSPDVPVAQTFQSVLTRRRLLQAGGLLSAAALVPGLAACGQGSRDAAGPGFDFADLPQTVGTKDAVAEGYRADVLVRWGDGIMPNAPGFDPKDLNAAAQERQFGYNCDFVAFFPLPKGSNSSEHGLLVVNHEYTSWRDMMPELPAEFEVTAEMAALDQAAHGVSVLEVKKSGGRWAVVEGSAYGRRITARTPMRVSGPAAGHNRMKTKADPDGRYVLGTLANCAGGKTPWGTALVAEENFNRYFSNPPLEDEPERGKLLAAGISGTRKNGWASHDPRFDLTQEPREANRFGWIVEIDPYTLQSVPVKRTALGRFRHEAATIVVNKDKRIVAYLGEDRPGGCIFRFVSRGTYDAANPAANERLLDEGELSVAAFDERTVTWVPLKPGEGRLGAYAGIADILIDAFACGTLAGGTAMDRPEDVETNPVNNRVYVNLTNNEYRAFDTVNPANPRAGNRDGQILELIPPGIGPDADHAAASYAWSMLMLCGPGNSGSKYGAGSKIVLSSPDNLAFDPKGRLWIATDNTRWSEKEGAIPNGLYACAVDGPERATVRFFYNCPAGAELCGPEFTPDGETLFMAIQHPGEEVSKREGLLWPDFTPGMPARPSVVVVQRLKGGPIGG